MAGRATVDHAARPDCGISAVDFRWLMPTASRRNLSTLAYAGISWSWHGLNTLGRAWWLWPVPWGSGAGFMWK